MGKGINFTMIFGYIYDMNFNETLNFNETFHFKNRVNCAFARGLWVCFSLCYSCFFIYFCHIIFSGDRNITYCFSALCEICAKSHFCNSLGPPWCLSMGYRFGKNPCGDVWIRKRRNRTQRVEKRFNGRVTTTTYPRRETTWHKKKATTGCSRI